MIERRRFLQVTSAAALAAAGCADDTAAGTTPDVPDASTPDDATPFVPGDAVLDDVALDDVTPDAAASDDAALDAPAVEDTSLPDVEADAGADAEPSDVRVDGGTTDPARLPEDLTAFPFAVMSGEMTRDSAVLWTRFAAAGTLVLHVRDAEWRPVLEREVTPADGGFVHALVTGLRAGQRYRYTFVRREGGRDMSRSAVGRFRAALADDAMEVVTFAGTSCTHQRARPFPTLAHAGGRDDLDFFVHGGDMTYCDGARSLADFRAKYAENLSSAGMRALLASTGLYATLDDHEIDNNFNPETAPASTLASARTAYFEHHPQRRDPASPDRVWRSARWGRTLEMWVLDTRTERRPSTRSSASAQYVSRAQMDWLKAGLAASTAAFKLIVNSVPITNFPLAFDLASADRWEGYAAQRREILDHIEARRVEGVWWLSGDFHFGCVALVESSGAASRMREVLMGPGGQNQNVLHASLIGRQWEFKTGENNYTVFRCDPMARAMTVSFVNGAGREIFSRRYA